jgi:hypothetical protein
MESGEIQGGTEKDRRCLEKKLTESGIKRDEWWPRENSEHEATFAIEISQDIAGIAGRVQLWQPAYRLSRDEWKKAHQGNWITGSIDWLDWGDRRCMAHIDDLKTGRWLTNPATSKQLRSYALLPWLLAGRPMNWDGIVSITHWPRYPLHALPTRTSHVLSAFDLMEHLEDLAWAVSHPDEVNPGHDACMFCPCRVNCPAWASESEDGKEDV